MVDLIPPPDPRALLPPLLACLPTAFVSPQPPPALLSLLSPILRQRVQILSSVAASPTDSWLRLLCWDAGQAERLQELVDGASFEPHPVSGEIELPDELPVRYNRMDEETLRSRVIVPEYSLQVLYLWCPDDQEGGGPAWRVAELLPQEGDVGEEPAWVASIGDANVHQKENLLEDALKATESDQHAADEKEAEDGEDDDYWAQYDATPDRTPAVKTPAPKPVSSLQQSETDYFSRYGDVQPALDNHDPEEEQPELGPSSLNGDMLAKLLQRQFSGGETDQTDQTADAPATNGNHGGLSHPRPSSISSGSSDAVARLEQEAENQSSYEVGVKQHIGSSIKGLFRLAKATGISRSDFQSLVKTELELLNVSDE
ncbi:hypothetical protein BO70DRAFT_377722 [Aspergillus heteromorphus CBS 117.55]|uniref:Uncharacterized protein n=1 Tax=Aspergillus heteromorphus CBS 117.55 TaxID=1448321 RepID=A0A317WSJ4_9EURO|nr:uncharacterized protein BO70DRAFT_377722 [Aspergillus heteromorphus CBS 117.55]PWY89349.1 hypothetical protein BO70DRAFT_377722 [Aspergillus heteromorphus CBS 117.55]